MAQNNNSIDSIIDSVMSVVPKILTEYVADVAEDILSEHIESDIYDVNEPQRFAWNGGTYHRRHELEKNIESWMGEPDTLYITSTGSLDGPVVRGYSAYDEENGGFLRLLESGNLGFYRKNFPRPALTLTQNEINSSSAIIRAIERGIKREIG